MAPDTAGEALAGELARLVDQSIWATRTWIEYVHARADREGRPRQLLAHIVLAERVWFERIDGEPRTKDTFSLMERDDLVAELEENRRRYQTLIATRLDDVVHFTRASGARYHARVVDILLQLLTHAYHHRGQLAAFHASQGVPYPSTDHIDYLIAKGL